MKESKSNKIFDNLRFTLIAIFVCVSVVHCIRSCHAFYKPIDVDYFLENALEDANRKNENDQKKKDNTEAWVRDIEGMWENDSCGTYDPRDRGN